MLLQKKWFVRHTTLSLIIAIILGITALGLYWGYANATRQLTNHYRHVLEKKTWSQLDVFQQGNIALVNDYFESALNVVANLANDETVRHDLANHEYKAVEEIFDRQRLLNRRFGGLGVLDKAGTFILRSSVSPTSKQFISQNFSQREYFIETMRTKRPTITTLFDTVMGNNVLIFSAPVIGSDGEVAYMVNGTVSLSALGDKLHLHSVFADLDWLLTDKLGVLLIANKQVPAEKTAINTRDRLVQRLVDGESDAAEDEINWQQTHVFARGNSITLDGGNKILLVSSFPKNQFDSELTSLHQELAILYISIAFRFVLIILLAAILIALILKRHDALVHHQ